jgi:hypothetical protein
MSLAIIDTGYGYKYRYETERNLSFSYDFYHNDSSTYDPYNRVSHFDMVRKSAEDMGYSGDYAHLKVFSDDDYDGKTSYVTAALEWLVLNATTYNITTVSMSLQTIISVRRTEKVSPFDDYFKALYENDIMVTIAAGNYGANTMLAKGVSQYAASKYVTVVSASNEDGTQADYSSYSPFWTDIVANGDISFDGHTAKGTSFSTPRVAGFYEVVKARVEEARGYTLTPYEFKAANEKIADTIAFRYTGLSHDDYPMPNTYKETPRLADEADFMDYLLQPETIVDQADDAENLLSSIGNDEALNTLRLSESDDLNLMLMKQDNQVFVDARNADFYIFFSFDKYHDSSDDDAYYNTVILEGGEADWHHTTLLDGSMERLENETMDVSVNLIGVDNIVYTDLLAA